MLIWKIGKNTWGKNYYLPITLTPRENHSTFDSLPNSLNAYTCAHTHTHTHTHIYENLKIDHITAAVLYFAYMH